MHSWSCLIFVPCKLMTMVLAVFQILLFTSPAINLGWFAKAQLLPGISANALPSAKHQVTYLRVLLTSAVFQTLLFTCHQLRLFAKAQLLPGISAKALLSVDGVSHTPSITFLNLPPNSARFSYATEAALFISVQQSTNAVSTLRKVWVLIRL